MQASSFAAGGPILPRRPVPVVASTTATIRPVNPFVIQSDRLAFIRAQVAANNAINAIGAVVLPAVVKTNADLLKQQRLISSVARRPTFVLGLAVQQAEADAGADWARNWFKGRAEAGLGGLTPADASMSQAIKRPVVPDEATWKAMGANELSFGKTPHGNYYLTQNVVVISPTTPYPQSVAVHEATHQWQEAMKNSPAMKRGMVIIKQSLPPSAGSGPRMDGDIYWEQEIEDHAHINQLRHALGYKPDEMITKKRLMDDLKNYPGRKDQSCKHAVSYFNSAHISIDTTVNWLNELP